MTITDLSRLSRSLLREALDVAAAAGDWSTVHKIMREAGSRPRRANVEAAEIVELYELNWSAAEIADKFHMHRDTVVTRLREAGIH